MLSMGVFSPATHPQFRRYLYHFVSTPGGIDNQRHIMDSYWAYGVKREVSVDNERNDFLGLPNTIRPQDARVLFVGDSFGAGASVGSRAAPAVFFSRLTHGPVYNASHGAYGLAQYVALIRKLTRDLPGGERFAGTDVVVLTFIGNDYTSDIAQYEKNRLYVDHPILWIARIGPICSWVRYLVESSRRESARSVPVGKFAPIPVRCATAENIPFAVHPGFAIFTAPDRVRRYFEKARPFVAELAALRDAGLRVKIVVVPTGLQVVYDAIDWDAMSPTSECTRELPVLYALMTELTDRVVRLYAQSGFETLDLRDVFRDAPDHCRYYQPADTHCTALGYEAIARAIAARWPELGKDVPPRP